MKFIPLASLIPAGIGSLILTTVVAQAESIPTPGDAKSLVTYADVAPIIADNCQICHTGGNDAIAGISLDTEAEVLAVASQMYTALDSGLMPYGDSEWHTSADGQKLMDWLEAQIAPNETPASLPAPSK